MVDIPVKLIGSQTVPVRATRGSDAFDLKAAIDGNITLHPHKVVMVGTGVCLDMSRVSGMSAILLIRSGLGKNGITLANGVGLIDNDYQGEIKAALCNISNEPYTIEPGNRICQLLFIPTFRPLLTPVCEFINITGRGDGGFGHTGV